MILLMAVTGFLIGLSARQLHGEGKFLLGNLLLIVWLIMIFSLNYPEQLLRIMGVK